MTDRADAKLRLDKWLWHARFFKSRRLAAEAVERGVRVNQVRVSKPARTVGPGDILTFAQAKTIRVVRVVEIGERRGPASEAQELYEDLTPQSEPQQGSHDRANTSPKFEGSGRPTKKDRRAMIKSFRSPLE